MDYAKWINSPPQISEAGFKQTKTLQTEKNKLYKYFMKRMNRIAWWKLAYKSRESFWTVAKKWHSSDGVISW